MNALSQARGLRLRARSWNVYSSNQKIEQAAAFIEHSHADVLCLQEVPPALMERIQLMSFHVHRGLDTTRRMKKSGREMQDSTVILSRHPIIEYGNHKLPFSPQSPLEARFSRSFTTTNEFDFLFRDEREAISAVIDVNGQEVRVFCVHLTFYGPPRREREFTRILQAIDPQRPNVICGDLNVFEDPALKLYINWRVSSTPCQSIWQSTPFFNERARFEEQFAGAGLINPLRHQVTHEVTRAGYTARSQLDHILIPAGARVHEASVHENSVGSDHRPVTVEFSL